MMFGSRSSHSRFFLTFEAEGAYAMRLVYVSQGPRPYLTPVLNALSDLVDLHVIHMSIADPLYNFQDVWGEAPRYKHSTYWSKNIGWHSRDVSVEVSMGVSRRLHALDPDVILLTGWKPLGIEPLLWKKLTGRKAVIWSESTSFTGLLRGRVSNEIRHLILAQADAFVTNGTKATEFLEELGIDAGRIITSCLSSSLLSIPAEEDRERDHAAGGRDGPRFLFVGRLIDRKQPRELLQVFATVLDQLPNATLTVVGEGPLMSDVQQAAALLHGRVRVLGRREGSALAATYGEADILVVPSLGEVWGLVVNEGLAAGLYVIATDQVASAFDLLDQESGTIVPAENTAALATAMVAAGRNVNRDPATRLVRMGRVAPCTPAEFAKSIYSAAALALETAERHSSVSGTGRKVPANQRDQVSP